MGRLSEEKLEKKIGLKRIRARARLEASIWADRVLNEIEEDYCKEFDRRDAAGEPFKLDSETRWVADKIAKALPEKASE